MLLHRLALALGKTVGEIDCTMTVTELRDWARFEAFHQPLPDKLADLHFAIVSSIVVNLARGSEGTPAKPADFLVLRERVAPVLDGPSEVDRAMAAWRGG